MRVVPLMDMLGTFMPLGAQCVGPRWVPVRHSANAFAMGVQGTHPSCGPHFTTLVLQNHPNFNGICCRLLAAQTGLCGHRQAQQGLLAGWNPLLGGIHAHWVPAAGNSHHWWPTAPLVVHFNRVIQKLPLIQIAK